jgi:hypothetical protein
MAIACNLVIYTYYLEGLPNVGYFNLSSSGEEALCMFCEVMQKKMAAASRAAALLRELLDSMTPVEARDRAMAEIGGVAVAEEEGFS